MSTHTVAEDGLTAKAGVNGAIGDTAATPHLDAAVTQRIKYSRISRQPWVTQITWKAACLIRCAEKGTRVWDVWEQMRQPVSA